MYRKLHYKMIIIIKTQGDWGGGECGRNSHEKGMGVLIKNFEKNPKELPKSCFVGMAWNFFTPERYSTNSKTIYYMKLS